MQKSSWGWVPVESPNPNRGRFRDKQVSDMGIPELEKSPTLIRDSGRVWGIVPPMGTGTGLSPKPIKRGWVRRRWREWRAGDGDVIVIPDPLPSLVFETGK
ncbi:unnamed protein product [Prunus armeniaca]